MLKGRKTDNSSMRVYLETIESIVGHHGLKSVLNYAHLEKYIDNFPPPNNQIDIPLEDLQNLCRSLLELFGKKGIRSLQLRVGREIIRRSLEKRSCIVKLLLLLRLLPSEHSQVKRALNGLMRAVEKSYPCKRDILQGAQLELREDEDYFFIIYRGNWESEDVLSSLPVCHVTVGAIGAFLEWATGHVYEVKEIECKAMGHPADVFRISKMHEEEINLGSPDSSKDRVRPFLVRF
ncbi:MAG: 4-vinyl reductase [Candidatus Methanofastidiosia archaeon]